MYPNFFLHIFHYCDVIMGAMAYQIARLTKFCLLLKQFIQTKIKENFKAPRHWPLVGNAENVSNWWRHHVKLSSRSQCLSLGTVW